MQANEIKPMALEALKLIDAILLIDHSTSMDEMSLRFSGKNRMHEVEEAAIGIARAAEKFDTDGITVIPFSTKAVLVDNVTSDKVKQVFAEYTPNGNTNLAAALELALEKAQKSGKQTAVMIYTDGEPNDEKAVMNILNRAGTTLGRPKIGFVFVQVGTAPGATKFLEKLDDELTVDVVDTLSAADAENLGYPELVYCAFNG